MPSPRRLSVRLDASDANTDVSPRQRYGLRTPRGARREHDHGAASKSNTCAALFGEVDDTLGSILLRHFAATAQRRAARAGAAERLRSAGLGGRRVHAGGEARAHAAPRRTDGGRCGHLARQHGLRAFQQARTRWSHRRATKPATHRACGRCPATDCTSRHGQAVVERGTKREAAVRGSQHDQHVRRIVRQIHGDAIARTHAAVQQEPRERSGQHARLAIRVRRLVARSSTYVKHVRCGTVAPCSRTHRHRCRIPAFRLPPARRAILRKLGELGEVGGALLLERVATLLRLVGGVVQKRGVAGELLDARKPSVAALNDAS